MSDTSKNIVEKIWEKHVVKQNPGHPAILGIDLELLHEVTSPQAFSMLESRNLPVKYPKNFVGTLDHSIPTRTNRDEIYDESAKNQVLQMRQNMQKHNLKFYDFNSGNQGIVHVIGPELGLTQPGMTIVCGDSHTSTHGAFGALAFGVGTTEVGLVLATGCILQDKPKTMKVEFSGQFSPGVFSKDAILKLISQIGVGGANGYVIEFTGQAVRNMSMEARMSMCNMSIECGARAGLVGPDENTFKWILGENYEQVLAANSINSISTEKELQSIQAKKYAPELSKWADAIAEWSSFASDSDCQYDREITINVSDLAPMVSWGTNPAQSIAIDEKIPSRRDISADEQVNFDKALDYTKLKENENIKDLPINWVFLGSCTNSRLEDLRIAAGIFYPELKKTEMVTELRSGEKLIIRKADPRDAKDISKVREVGWIETYVNEELGITKEKIADKVKTTQDKIDRWVETIQDPEKFVFVAEVKDKVVGWCVGNTIENSLNAEIAIYILPEFQSQKIGQKMMTVLLDKLKKYSKIELETVTYNSKAISFYKKLGFETTNEYKKTYSEIELPLYKMELSSQNLHNFLENEENQNQLKPTIDESKIRKIAPNVTMYVVPGSEEVKKQAEKEGLDAIFKLAGCDWRMPGCSMCLGMNDDKVPTGKRCLSTSNRNFMHRQGPGAITHLCSPATAAFSSIQGRISDVRENENT